MVLSGRFLLKCVSSDEAEIIEDIKPRQHQVAAFFFVLHLSDHTHTVSEPRWISLLFYGQKRPENRKQIEKSTCAGYVLSNAQQKHDRMETVNRSSCNSKIEPDLCAFRPTLTAI